MAGTHENEYRWAVHHPDDPDAKELSRLASLYAARPEPVCLALIEAVCEKIRDKMTTRTNLYSCPACGADIERAPGSRLRLRCACGYAWSGEELEDERERTERRT